jgi:hypothetical protein
MTPHHADGVTPLKVEVGYERTNVAVGDRIVTLKTLSLQPLVLSIDGFLSNEECTVPAYAPWIPPPTIDSAMLP